MSKRGWRRVFFGFGGGGGDEGGDDEGGVDDGGEVPTATS